MVLQVKEGDNENAKSKNFLFYQTIKSNFICVPNGGAGRECAYVPFILYHSMLNQHLFNSLTLEFHSQRWTKIEKAEELPDCT